MSSPKKDFPFKRLQYLGCDNPPLLHSYLPEKESTSFKSCLGSEATNDSVVIKYHPVHVVLSQSSCLCLLVQQLGTGQDVPEQAGDLQYKVLVWQRDEGFAEFLSLLNAL